MAAHIAAGGAALAAAVVDARVAGKWIFLKLNVNQFWIFFRNGTYNKFA
jgi:hypothetical protein